MCVHKILIIKVDGAIRMFTPLTIHTHAFMETGVGKNDEEDMKCKARDVT